MPVIEEKTRKVEIFTRFYKTKGKEVKKETGGKSILRQIKVLQEQTENFADEEICRNFKSLQQKSFEGTNKVGKYLVWQLKKKRV